MILESNNQLKQYAFICFLCLILCSCATGPNPQEIQKHDKTLHKPLLAIVLGSGGAKGYAHIGVLKALEANAIQPELIIASSAGSVVGALYAAGYGAFEIQKLALEIEENTLFNWTFPDRGFIDGLGLQDTINRTVGNRKIEELDRSLVIVATDLHKGSIKTFIKGDTGLAVRASCSVPGIFKPVKIDGSEFIDGGVSSPLPVQAAINMGADIIIAVNITSISKNSIPTSSIEVLARSLEIMGSSFAQTEAALADIVIQPDLRGISSSDFESKNYAILQGERAGIAAKEKIKKMIEDFSKKKKSIQ